MQILKMMASLQMTSEYSAFGGKYLRIYSRVAAAAQMRSFPLQPTSGPGVDMSDRSTRPIDMGDLHGSAQ